MTIKHVLVVIIMEQEAKPFIDHLGLTSVEGFFPSHTPFLAYNSNSNTSLSCQVTVITVGKDTIYGTGVDNVGTVPASLGVYLALTHPNHSFDLVINAGTCGGFQQSAQKAEIGNVFLTSGVAHHDRRIPIPGFDQYGIGKLSSSSTPSIIVDPTKLAATLGYKIGVCTTGNSLDHVEKDEELMKANEASVKDMEAAGIAWTCRLSPRQTPYLGVKVVTDIVDGDKPTQDEFMANLASAAASLQQALPKVLEEVANKELAEL